MNLEPLYIVGAALARNIVGWIKTSFEDGEISLYEKKQLAATILRVGFIGVIIAYFPGLDLSWFDASVAAVAVDMIFSAIKKVGKK